MSPQLRQNLQVSFQLLLAILYLLASVTHLLSVMGNLRPQAVLSLMGQMTMMLILHPTLQPQRDKQTYCDGKEMQKEIPDAVQLSVGCMNVEHNVLPTNKILLRPRAILRNFSHGLLGEAVASNHSGKTGSNRLNQLRPIVPNVSDIAAHSPRLHLLCWIWPEQIHG